MSSHDIDQIVAEARSVYPRVRVTGGASNSEIEQLETLVGAIPPSYKHFLAAYGTFGFYGLEIYGLIAGNLEGEGPPNAYFMTKTDVADGSIPDGHIVVNSTGYGPVYLLNCATGNVVGWNYTGVIDEELPKYEAFENFLADLTSATLEDYKQENQS